jgi:hypothetical protein
MAVKNIENAVNMTYFRNRFVARASGQITPSGSSSLFCPRRYATPGHASWNDCTSPRPDALNFKVINRFEVVAASEGNCALQFLPSQRGRPLPWLIVFSLPSLASCQLAVSAAIEQA